MKTFETIGDIVDNAIELHRQAARGYRRLRDTVSNERVRMLLGYMMDHQEAMETSVDQIKRSVGDAVLGTYIQYSLDENPLHFMRTQLDQIDTLDLEETERLAGRVDDYLVDLFEEALQEMDSPKVKEFLQDLLDLERLERRKLTMSISSMMDM